MCPLAEKFFYSATYVRHLETPFEASAIKHFSCLGTQAGSFRMVSAMVSRSNGSKGCLSPDLLKSAPRSPSLALRGACRHTFLCEPRHKIQYPSITRSLYAPL